MPRSSSYDRCISSWNHCLHGSNPNGKPRPATGVSISYEHTASVEYLNPAVVFRGTCIIFHAFENMILPLGPLMPVLRRHSPTPLSLHPPYKGNSSILFYFNIFPRLHSHRGVEASLLRFLGLMLWLSRPFSVPH